MSKRKTLPKDLHETVATGNIEAIKTALKKCEPNAYSNDYYKDVALMHTDLPEEVVRWLVTEYGADINACNTYGHTALSEAAIYHPERIDLLLSLGADIDFQKDSYPTALIYAAMYYRAEGVKKLVECGADVHRTGGYSHYNALEEALARCENVNIPQMAALAKILIDAGIAVTPAMREKVTRIGERFAFYRDSFNPDYLDEVDTALRELYQIFDVPPVPRLQKYDGSAPIAVKGQTWTEQYHELWEMLVPGSGRANFAQGEAIRLAGRLSHEILDNGGCNWDKVFRAMRDKLAQILSGGKAADEAIIREVRGISPDTDDVVFTRVAKAVVEWILANPDPLPLGEVPYQR